MAKEKTRSRTWISVCIWIVLGTIVFGFLLHVAGITFNLSSGKFEFKELEQATRGQVIASAVTWLGAIGALVTFLLNREQKDRHLRDQLEQERNLEAGRRRQERLADQRRRAQEIGFEANREKRERDLAELQRLESEFAALVQSFSSQNSLSRISAAIGLSEIARQPDPRRVPTGEDLPSVDEEHYKTLCSIAGEIDSILDTARPWPDDWKGLKSERNYPYFRRAIERLSIGLVHFDDVLVRSEYRNALEQLASWAKEEGTDESLLHLLVNRLAETNRLCWKACRAALLTSVKSGNTEAVTYDLCMRTSMFRSVKRNSPFEDIFIKRFTKYAHAASSSRKKEEFSWLLPSENITQSESAIALSIALLKLWDSRDCLAAALRELSRPPDFRYPVQETDVNGEVTLASSNCKDRRGLNLDGIQMPLSDIRHAQLHDIEMRGAFLMGSDMQSIKLPQAMLRNVNLSLSNLTSAHLQHSTISDSNFQTSLLDGTDFSSSRLNQVVLIEVKGKKRSFKGASLTACDFTEATMACSDFSNSVLTVCGFKATRLRQCTFDASIISNCSFEHADVGGSTLAKAKMIVSCNWESASFISAISLAGDITYDKELWNHFNKTHPLSDGDVRIPPWERPENPSA